MAAPRRCVPERVSESIERIQSRVDHILEQCGDVEIPSVHSGSVGVEPEEKTVTEEMQKYDLNGDGILDEEERRIMLEDKRRKMMDDDAQRDQQRQMVWFVLFGMLGYPFFVIGAAFFGLESASDILGSMASIYFPATSLILAAFFGSNAYAAKKS